MNKERREKSRYDAPFISGYSHLGNSSNESEEEALEAAKKCYNAHSIFVRPFFPDGNANDGLWKYRTKWAVYGVWNV